MKLDDSTTDLLVLAGVGVALWVMIRPSRSRTAPAEPTEPLLHSIIPEESPVEDLHVDESGIVRDIWGGEWIATGPEGMAPLRACRGDAFSISMPVGSTADVEFPEAAIDSGRFDLDDRVLLEIVIDPLKHGFRGRGEVRVTLPNGSVARINFLGRSEGECPED